MVRLKHIFSLLLVLGMMMLLLSGCVMGGYQTAALSDWCGCYISEDEALSGVMVVQREEDGDYYATFDGRISYTSFDVALHERLRLKEESKNSVAFLHELYTNGNLCTDFEHGDCVYTITRTENGLSTMFRSDQGRTMFQRTTEDVVKEYLNRPDKDSAFYYDGVGTGLVKEEAVGQADLWEGDYYGWWYINGSSGGRTNPCWDVCGRLKAGERGTGTLILWDTAGSYDMPLGKVWLSFSMNEDGQHCAISMDGYFMERSTKIKQGDWEITMENEKYEDFIVIHGTYSGQDYTVYLRPWGTLWDEFIEEAEALEWEANAPRRAAQARRDSLLWQRQAYPERAEELDDLISKAYVPAYITVTPDIPTYYESWYLLLLEKGMDMPDQISSHTEERYSPAQQTRDNRERF